MFVIVLAILMNEIDLKLLKYGQNGIHWHQKLNINGIIYESSIFDNLEIKLYIVK